MNNTPSDSLCNSILFLYVRFFWVIVFEELLFIHHIEFAFYDILCLKWVESRKVGYSQHGASDKLHLMCSFVVIHIGGRAYGAGWASIVAWPTTFLLPCLFFFHFVLNTFRQWMQISLCHFQQGTAIPDKPAQHAASWRTCCKQIRWTLSVINLWPS